MALITVPELAAAIRVGGGTTEAVQITRLLQLAVTELSRFAPDAPEAVLNEAIVRYVGYLYDAPSNAGASAITGSGAGSLLIPYRRIRGGSVSGESASTGGTAVPVPAPAGGSIATWLITWGWRESNGTQGELIVDYEVNDGHVHIDYKDRTDQTELAYFILQEGLSVAHIDILGLQPGLKFAQVGSTQEWRANVPGITPINIIVYPSGLQPASGGDAGGDAGEDVTLRNALSGGVVGQVLTKASNLDLEFEWAAGGGGGNVVDQVARDAAGIAQRTANNAIASAAAAQETADDAVNNIVSEDARVSELEDGVSTLQHITREVIGPGRGSWVAGSRATAQILVTATPEGRFDDYGGFMPAVSPPSQGWPAETELFILVSVYSGENNNLTLYPITNVRVGIENTTAGVFHYYNASDFDFFEDGLAGTSMRYYVRFHPPQDGGTFPPGFGRIICEVTTGDTTYVGNVTGELDGQPVADVILPKGGASGQVIAKKSGTDYDVDWVDAGGTAVDQTARTAASDAQSTADSAATVAASAATTAAAAATAASAAKTAADANTPKVLPAGGTMGQVLAKKSGTDYDTEWVDNSGGGGAAKQWYVIVPPKSIGRNTQPTSNSLILGPNALPDTAAATKFTDSKGFGAAMKAGTVSFIVLQLGIQKSSNRKEYARPENITIPIGDSSSFGDFGRFTDDGTYYNLTTYLGITDAIIRIHKATGQMLLRISVAGQLTVNPTTYTAAGVANWDILSLAAYA